MLETPEKQYVDDPSTVLKQLSLISRSIGHTMRLRPWILWLLLSSGGGATPSALLADDAIPAGSSWRYFKGRAPASTPGTLWRQKDFVDTSWTQGSSPFFYGEPFSGTALTDMQGGYSSVYLRRQFSTTDPGKTGSLVLHALSDDGFIAWLNGKEIARFNVPEGELTYDVNALPALQEPLFADTYVVPRPWEILNSGVNVLAIHAFNSSLSGSSDFVMEMRLAASVDTAAPTVVDTLPPENATVDELQEMEVFFSEPVVGVKVGDLLVNGVASTEVRQIAPAHFSFSFPQPPKGDVEFHWRDGHQITDDLGAPNAFVGGSWKLKLAPEAARKNLMISEFMGDNDKTLLDDDKDKSDWIEIYNAGATPVSLLGWSLTDDALDLAKWQFPDYTLEGDSYLVVFASQKNKINPTKRLHTNFKLDEKGDYLGLVTPDGEVISEFAPLFPRQTRDISYGRVSGAPNQVGFFTKPTPGSRNVESGAGFAPPVDFSRSSGTFVQPFSLLLSCNDPFAVIRYTLDGSFPHETNQNLRTYSGPFGVSNTVQVRARAFEVGLLPGPPTSETYLALTNSPAHFPTFTSTLPIIILTTLKSAAIGGTRNTALHVSLYEPVNGQTSLRSRPTLSTRGGAKTRGSSTGGQPQSNFAIEWWDEFDQDKDLAVLGMPEDSEWVLYAPNTFDPPLIHNPFTMEISRQMNFSAPRTRFVEVYLNKGGPIRSNDWFGVYVLMEKPGLSKNRINAPKAQPEDVAFPEVTGSYMFKTDRLDAGDNGFSAGGAQNAYVEPKEREMKSPQRAPQLAYLKKYFADLDAALRATNPNWRDPVLGYRGFIEITNWIDFHILETLSGQVDAIRLSTYFYKRREGKLEYGPRWDYDRAWESKGDDRDNNPRVWDTGGGLFSSPWWPRVLADRDSWQLWIDRWQAFRLTALSQNNMFSVIDRMTNQVYLSQPREAKRWSETLPRTSYANEIRIMKTWISNRLEWIDLQMAHPPRLSSESAVVTPGFTLTIQPPLMVSNPTNVTLFYTLDGTDPRPSGGTNTPTSLTYLGPITLTANARVVARVRDNGKIQRGPPSSSTWSSPVAATFVVKPPQLVLTELMFHPEPAPSGSLYTASDFEFLELKNISSEPVDLVGYHFTAGIDYRFTPRSAVTRLAPGERVLVVGNQAAFLSRYPGVTQIAGQFAGSLDDQGERLALAGPVEEPLFDLRFSDRWQPLAGGFGFSLVLADEATPTPNATEPGRWRLSTVPGGSPGLMDPAPIPVPHVKVNELLSHPRPGKSEWLELYNPEATPADLSGWWLTDSLGAPKKVRLPAGTKISARGFLVLDEKVFHQANAPGFGLNNLGDDVWLFSADAEGNLTGWRHGFTFAAADQDVSFGRFETSTGAEHFVAQISATPAALNAGPRVGPIVISEILYDPPAFGSENNQHDEFVELHNVTDQSALLFDPAARTNTWLLRGGVEFNFPPDVVLPPRGHLLVVGFSPAKDPFAESAFRARYGLDASVPLFGPWRNALNNDTETLQLVKPSLPEGANTQRGAYVVVDQVAYSADPPWPEGASGTGLSITRKGAFGYGDDPSNWYSATATPGDADEDADGLPDAWERLHGLDAADPAGPNGGGGDPDGDGFNSRQEYLNRTDPSLRASFLALRAYPGGEGVVHFTFASPPGRSFLLQTRPSLTSGTWQPLRSLLMPAAGMIQTTELATDSEGYYRLATE